MRYVIVRDSGSAGRRAVLRATTVRVPSLI